jgi:hypothetical protein
MHSRILMAFTNQGHFIFQRIVQRAQRDREQRREEKRIVERADRESKQEEEERTKGRAEQLAERRVARRHGGSTLRRIVEDNALVLTALGLFALTLIGLIFAGAAHENEEREHFGLAAQSVVEYLASGSFWESIAENWEAEFLQMTIFVVLTAFLHQRGSAESKKIEEPEPVDADAQAKRDAPAPVRKGGLALTLYKHSLSTALALFFILTIVTHAFAGRAQENEERAALGEPLLSVGEYVTSSRFWWEALQNWQSGFFGVLILTVLTIFLREQGSAQSKPVAAPHLETGR